MRILNLYAGIGGNRKLWPAEHTVTAVELNPAIAAVYADLFPNDVVVVGDAHAYLLENFDQFDFIWSSPPCQSHSNIRYNLQVQLRGTPAVYPDMSLYEEIVFLQNHGSARWVVENVQPYYNGGKPLIPAYRIDRHLYWSNFYIPNRGETNHENLRTIQIADLEAMHGFDLSKYRLPGKRQILRNCVSPAIGLRILDAATDETYNAMNGRLF